MKSDARRLCELRGTARTLASDCPSTRFVSGFAIDNFADSRSQATHQAQELSDEDGS